DSLEHGEERGGTRGAGVARRAREPPVRFCWDLADWRRKDRFRATLEDRAVASAAHERLAPAWDLITAYSAGVAFASSPGLRRRGWSWRCRRRRSPRPTSGQPPRSAARRWPARSSGSIRGTTGSTTPAR